eukprot:gb/GECG01015412.1/.p1 GENE.gb/GECG01015412.1/~~gb/GECG01015412.1/.p1  ORF type:complete len:385 (+),score=40.30 gb/GECG01015412.1/:1-1155(+)
MEIPDTDNELLFIGFNQDYGCFACGTTNGFRIFNVEPFKETFRRVFASGGIRRVEMLFRCNILALVGGGPEPRYPPHKVMIWDDHQNRCIGELSFRSEVRNVKLRRDRVVVVLQNKVYVYNFADLNLLDHLETVDNPRGLCAVCPDADNTVLACPAGQKKGHVRVELYDKRQQTLIPAHEGSLACIALNQNGKRLATASEKGTLIRIFCTETGGLLQELRRGADKAVVYSIAFSGDSRWLACTSDKGTVHIFCLNDDVANVDAQGVVGISATAASEDVPAPLPSSSGEGGAAAGGAATVTRDRSGSNSKSSFSFIKGLLPKYFSSEWSYAQLRVEGGRSIVAFGQDPYTVVVITQQGTFYKANFRAGGEAERETMIPFVQASNQ